MTQVAITFDGLDAAAACTAVGECRAAFAEWFSLLKDWVEVLTLQDLDHLAPRKRVVIEGSDWAAWLDGSEFQVPPRFILDLDYGEPLSPSRWSRVLDLVGAGTQPAVEHALLRDARASDVRSQ